MKKNDKPLPHYEFLRIFPEQPPQSVYYIIGSDVFLRNLVFQKIKDRFCQREWEDFDFSLFYGDNANPFEILEHLEMSPFLAKRRLIAIKAFDMFSADKQKIIAEYTKKPYKTSVLIIMAEKSDARLLANKILAEHSLQISCRPPYSVQDVENWLFHETKSRGMILDKNSLRIFAESIEPDYQIASMELEKLIIYTKNKKNISQQDIEESVGKSKTVNVFNLQNALGEKNLKEAIILLEKLNESNSAAVYIVMMLTRFFLQIWKILALREKNISDSEICQRYLNEVNFRFRQDYCSFADNYSLTNMSHIFANLLQADADLKSLNIKEDIILCDLLFSLCKK